MNELTEREKELLLHFGKCSQETMDKMARQLLESQEGYIFEESIQNDDEFYERWIRLEIIADNNNLDLKYHIEEYK